MTPHELKRLLPAHAEDGMATHILHACHGTGLPVSYALALLEKETGFRNVFGHDPTRAIPDAWKGTRVTTAKYRYYKARRRLGYGMQGVGPCQLTWYAFQDEADRIGGCHRPYPNLCVGFRRLRELVTAHGRQAGAAAYNGVGDAAEAYGLDFVRRQAEWHRRLT
jgi:hypothetical protein